MIFVSFSFLVWEYLKTKVGGSSPGVPGTTKTMPWFLFCGRMYLTEQGSHPDSWILADTRSTTGSSCVTPSFPTETAKILNQTKDDNLTSYPYEFWSDFLDHNDTRLLRYSFSHPMRTWRRMSSVRVQVHLMFLRSLRCVVFVIDSWRLCCAFSSLSNDSIFLSSRNWK